MVNISQAMKLYDMIHESISLIWLKEITQATEAFGRKILVIDNNKEIHMHLDAYDQFIIKLSNGKIIAIANLNNQNELGNVLLEIYNFINEEVAEL